MSRPLKRYIAPLITALALGLAGCAQAPVADGFSDPYEEKNRKRFERTIKVDRAVLRPVAFAYGESVPEPVRRRVSNFSANLGVPGSFVNDVLQANVDDAAHNFMRFLINTTIGIGGIFDPATSFGLTARDADFGETMHVWGIAEGHYVVLPLLGPSTQRDAVGSVVDLFTNPLGYVIPTPERYAMPATGTLSKLGERYRFDATIESILHDTADPYAQARLLHLESRRFALGGEQVEESYDDYEDFYSD